LNALPLTVALLNTFGVEFASLQSWQCRSIALKRDKRRQFLSNIASLPTLPDLGGGLMKGLALAPVKPSSVTVQ
jgi:hypothetical protein